eukprot:scaffold306_cov525-Prasinococcus_capsulatus_cf.AAC.59
MSRSILAVGLGAVAGVGVVASAGLGAAALVPYAMSSFGTVVSVAASSTVQEECAAVHEILARIP